jgi:hypothetical protein
MRSSSPQLAVSARRSRPPFVFAAFACITALLLGSNANAGTVLQFGQINPTDTVTATDTAGVTTLSTAGNVDGAGVSIPVTLTNFLGLSGVNIPVFETFVGVTSTAPAGSGAGFDYQAFTGTIEFTSAPGGLGANYLTATFGSSGAHTSDLFGSDGGTSATLSSSQPHASLVLTSDFATFASPTSMSIALGNLAPVYTIAGDGSIASFTAQNAGTFSASAVVPEPTSMALLGIGIASFFTYRRLFKRAATV